MTSYFYYIWPVVKLSLYDTLNIPADAPESRIRAAIRYLVKRFYRQTRDIGGDTEEGLRFANVTAAILLNDKSRRQYNANLSHKNNGQVSSNHAAQIDAAQDPHTELSASDLVLAEANLPLATPSELSLNTLTSLHSTTSPGRFFCLLCIIVCSLATIGLSSMLYAEKHWTSYAKLATLHIFVLLMLLILMFFFDRNKRQHGRVSGPKLAELPIIKWRRERAIDMGAHDVIEDQSWIYRLRVLEVERAKHMRTSQVSASRRIIARSIDIGLAALGIALIGLILTPITPYAQLLLSWWCLPFFAVLVHIPIELFSMKVYGKTLGKFMLGLIPMVAVTQLYASKVSPMKTSLIKSRTWAVATYGLAMGLPIVWLFAGLGNLHKLSFNQENKWDAKGDTVMTQVPLNLIQKCAALTASLALLFILLHLTWPSLAQSLHVTKELSQMTSKQFGERFSNMKLSDMWTSAGQQWKIPSMEVAKSDTRPLNQDPNVFRFENLADKKDRWQNWERQARQALTAGNAASLLGTCQKWAEEDYNNPQAHKCYGLALQANGSHARALTALRKAQSLDRLDTSIDQAIARSQLAQHRQ
ncbi:MAG: hypothetical protein RLZZ502_1398 [Pseudomonadota bacterium]